MRRTKKRNILHHPLTLVLLLFITIVLARSVYFSFKKRTVSISEQERYENEYQYLLEKKESLEADIQRLNTQRGREEEYRRRFNVSKEGESVIRIIEE